MKSKHFNNCLNFNDGIVFNKTFTSG